MMRNRIFPAALACALLSLVVGGLFVGCNSLKDVDRVRFYAEVPDIGISRGLSTRLTMERSGLRYTVVREPVIFERNIIGVDLIRVESGRLALQFMLDGEGTRALRRATLAHRGRHLIFTYNDMALGATRIDAPIMDGLVRTFVELPDERVEQLALQLQKNVEIVHDVVDRHDD